MEDTLMSMKTLSPIKTVCAAVILTGVALGFAAPASAQYSGNSVLRNPGASTPTPTIRKGGSYQPPPPNPYWRPGQFRSDMPGAGVNPSVRCPQGQANCAPIPQ